MLNALIARIPPPYRLAAGGLLVALGVGLVQARVAELVAQADALENRAAELSAAAVELAP